MRRGLKRRVLNTSKRTSYRQLCESVYVRIMDSSSSHELAAVSWLSKTLRLKLSVSQLPISSRLSSSSSSSSTAAGLRSSASLCYYY